MATLKSLFDWTGREIDGVTLGEPVYDEVTETYSWDHHAIPAEWVDENGDIWVEVENAPQGA